jgi:hypothetical protein
MPKRGQGQSTFALAYASGYFLPSIPCLPWFLICQLKPTELFLAGPQQQAVFDFDFLIE